MGNVLLLSFRDLHLSLFSCHLSLWTEIAYGLDFFVLLLQCQAVYKNKATLKISEIFYLEKV